MSEPLHVVCPQCAGINRLPRERLGQGPQCGRCHAALFDGRPVALNQATFERQVSRSDVPVVVDFWAPWCGPCRSMAPVFEAAAAQFEPQLRFAKVDTEAEQALAAAHGIRSIPTLAVFRNGREIARQAGALPPQQLAAWLRQVAAG